MCDINAVTVMKIKENMKKLLLAIILVNSTTIALAQSLSPLNPVIGGVRGLGLVEEDSSAAKVNFTIAPAKNTDKAALIWSNGERFNFLNNASVNATGNTGSAYLDLISDYLGPIRVSLSTTVSATDSVKNQATDENVERFLSGGGSAIVNFIFIGPTLSWNQDKSYLTLLVNPKVGFDFPALGLSTDEGATNLDFGLDLKFNMPLSQNNIGFTGNFRIGFVTGGDAFYQNLGLIGEDATSFSYSQASFGLTLPGINWAILWNKAISGPNEIKDFHKNGRISLVISPKK